MGADFNAKAYEKIYQHPSWEQTADRYEEQFAARLYHTPYVQQAAKTALTKLSRMLNAYYTRRASQGGAGGGDQTAMEDAGALAQVAGEVSGERVEITDVLQEALMQHRKDATGAGQIGSRQAEIPDELEGQERQEALEEARRTDRTNLDAVINEDGNLRERMTLLYNGMFLNGGKTRREIAGSRSLKNLLANVTEEETGEDRELSGLRMDLLSGMKQRSKGGDIFDTYSIARDLQKRSDQLKGHGNFVSRFFDGVKRAFNAAFSSRFIRRTKSPDQRVGLGMQHYTALGLDLSDRERANGLDEQGNLQWKEGIAWYEMKKKVEAGGMLQIAGPSGTTLRMLGAYKLMGATLQELLNFRLALIAWMGTSKDHSLFEILKGSHNAGVKGKEDLSEAAVMYTTVDPLPVDVLREEFAPDHQFPHETVYKIMLNELREKRAAQAERRNAAAMKKPEVAGEKGDRDYLKEHYEELKSALLQIKSRKKSAQKTSVSKESLIKKLTMQLAGELVKKGNLPQGTANEYNGYSVEKLLEDKIPESLLSEIGADNRKANALLQAIKVYQESKAFLSHADSDIQVYTDQQKYVESEIKARRERLHKKGYEVTEGYNFTLYGKSSDGVMRDIGEDAMNADAQDIALNIYTTGAYLAMTRGQKYWGGLGKRALSDERVDQYGETGFGAYEYSSSGEMGDSELSEEIFQMIRISSRMAQDALVERGENVEEISSDGERIGEVPGEDRKRAYRGMTYRGGRLTSGFRVSPGSFITVNSMMSSTKHIGKAAEYYHKSEEKNGRDNSVLIEYQMTGKGAVDISGVSKVQAEGEVLIPATTKFKVVEELRRSTVLEHGIHWEESGRGEPEERGMDEQAAVRDRGSGTRREKLPFYGYVVKLEEVSGPGSQKREEKGAVADMRRNIRRAYQQRLRDRQQRAMAGADS